MTQKASAKTIRREERIERELELRRRGLTYEQIAEQVGIANKGTVYRDIMAALKRQAERNDGKAAELRALELGKLDDLERAAQRVLTARHVTVNNGKVIYDPTAADHTPMLDDEPVLRAIATLLRIAERRARLLGLDAPAKLEQSGETESVVRLLFTDAPEPASST